jgi:hypothetical protein
MHKSDTLRGNQLIVPLLLHLLLKSDYSKNMIVTRHFKKQIEFPCKYDFQIFKYKNRFKINFLKSYPVLWNILFYEYTKISGLLKSSKLKLDDDNNNLYVVRVPLCF